DPAREKAGIWRGEEFRFSRDPTDGEEQRGPKVVLSPDATDDERYMAERWPLLFLPQPDRLPETRKLLKARLSRLGLPLRTITPQVVKMLRPRSERTRHFDLFNPDDLESVGLKSDGQPAFLQFSQTAPTEEGIKALADRYGPLTAPNNV